MWGSVFGESPIAPLRACLADPFKEMLETNSQKSQRISPCQSVSQSVSWRPICVAAPRAHSTTVSPDGSAPSVNTSISLFVRLCTRLRLRSTSFPTVLIFGFVVAAWARSVQRCFRDPAVMRNHEKFLKVRAIRHSARAHRTDRYNLHGACTRAHSADVP